jgi:hypothetical protein
MKPDALLRALFFAGVFVAASVIFSVTATAQSTTAPRDAADEDYELNIDESRTTEANYERSTNVEINNASVSVGVGAIVRAQKIDILLRGVTGRVRFRASLEAIRRRLEQASQNRPPNAGNR